MSFLRCINRNMLTSALATGHQSGKSNSGPRKVLVECNSAHKWAGGGQRECKSSLNIRITLYQSAMAPTNRTSSSICKEKNTRC